MCALYFVLQGDFAHSGFPEVSYSKMASTLVEKGYKVARIEQTETPDMMAERCKSELITFIINQPYFHYDRFLKIN